MEQWFQSTHPYGVRPSGTYATAQDVVSIHAPLRGATSIVDAFTGRDGFNPRTPTGCD